MAAAWFNVKPSQSSSSNTCQLLKNFNVSKLLGVGGFGAVIQVKNKLDGKEYAVKVAGMDAFLGLDVAREVKNLAAIPQHKNLVLYSTSWEDRLTTSDLDSIKRICKTTSSNSVHFRVPSGSSYLRALCIQMELCGKDLRHWLEAQTVVRDKENVEIFLQLQSGLRHIHKHNLIHRDLKPENIFFDKNNSTSVKIGDLGLAVAHTTMRSALHSNGAGTLYYYAPEQMTSSSAKHIRYDKMVDIYASGLILLELFYPKIQASKNNNSLHVLDRTFHNLKHGRQVPTSITANWQAVSKLILKMTESDKKNRPSADEIFDTFKKPSVMSSSNSNRFPTSSLGHRKLPAVVHNGITCDRCGMKPIVGVRYKCSICVNFDLCQTCERIPGVHNDKHGMIKMKTPKASYKTAITQPVPFLTQQQQQPVKSTSYASPVFPRFPTTSSSRSLNSNPWSMGSLISAFDSSYPRPRNFGPMMNSNKGQGHFGYCCDRCYNAITGTVYECTVCAKVKYCGHCYRSWRPFVGFGHHYH